MKNTYLLLMKLINLHTWGVFPFSFPVKNNTEAKGNLQVYISHKADQTS